MRAGGSMAMASHSHTRHASAGFTSEDLLDILYSVKRVLIGSRSEIVGIAQSRGDTKCSGDKLDPPSDLI